jgi:hypothetical protein
MRRILAAIGLLTAVPGGAQPAVAAGPTPSLLKDKMTIELEGNARSAVTHLLVGNEGDAGVITIQFIDDKTGKPLQLQHGEDKAVVAYKQSLAEHQVTPIDLTVMTEDSAVDGHIVVQPLAGKAAVATFVTARKPATSWLWFTVAGGGLAFLVVVLAWLAPGSGQAKLRSTLGVATDWKFNESWASTVTALGAVTGTVLGLTGFLDEVLHDVVVTRFIGLNALFLALVAAAPLTFSAFAKKQGDKRVGTVGGFLLASWVTLTAACGELIVLAIMLYMARVSPGPGYSRAFSWPLRWFLSHMECAPSGIPLPTRAATRAGGQPRSR